MSNIAVRSLRVASVLFAIASLAQAQTFTRLKVFVNPPDPNSALVVGKNGVFYGTTAPTETSGGTIFTATTGGNLKILHGFPTLASHGIAPQGPLTLDSTGNVYGATTYGGSMDEGVVFKINPQGVETVIISFSGTQGYYPNGGLVLNSGTLYGTTFWGGQLDCNNGSGCGVVYQVATTGQFQVIYTFLGGGDGAFPEGGLIQDSAGNLYGTTNAGGAFGFGTVFKLTTSGVKTILHSFDGNDGAYPVGQLLLDSEGNLYGVANQGGTDQVGTAYKIDSSGTFSVLFNFDGGTNGAYPGGGLVEDAGGNLYGTTSRGGDNNCNNGGPGCGVIYEINSSGVESVLHTFTGPDGIGANAPLTLVNGTLYGTATFGGNLKYQCEPTGSLGCGTMFKLTP